MSIDSLLLYFVLFIISQAPCGQLVGVQCVCVLSSCEWFNNNQLAEFIAKPSLKLKRVMLIWSGICSVLYSRTNFPFKCLNVPTKLSQFGAAVQGSNSCCWLAVMAKYGWNQCKFFKREGEGKIRLVPVLEYYYSLIQLFFCAHLRNSREGKSLASGEGNPHAHRPLNNITPCMC